MINQINQMMTQALQRFQSGDHDEAELILFKVLDTQPKNFDALHILGVLKGIKNQHQEALGFFRKALRVNSNDSFLNFNIAKAFSEIGEDEKALKFHSNATKLNPEHPEGWLSYGKSLLNLKKFDESLNLFSRAATLNPEYAEAWTNRGCVLNELGRFHEALDSFDRSLKINPHIAETWSNRGLALKDLNCLEEAVASYDKAIAINPDFAEAYSNRGNALQELKRFEKAVASYDRAISIKPDYADAYYNRGNVLQELKRAEEAVNNYDKALSIKPYYAEAYSNRGIALKDLNRLEEAVASYAKAIEIKPDYEYLLGTLLHTKMHICDWQDFDANAKNLLLKISEGKKSSPSFPILALTDSLSIQHKTAEIWINDNHPFNPSLDIISKLPRKEKIKLAFLSADFKEHPTGYNFVGFFENIDRDKFEVIAVSFLNITDSPLSRRLAAAFDVFKIVDKLSDTEVCKWVLDQKVDIAIDMMGPTLGNRGGILAMRCAPIQVNQFSWTSGAPYIDYIIADPISMPKEYAEAYSEKLAYVPHTLFATDDKREISIKTPLRIEQNLPEKGVVFCCLNNNFKITPHVFDSWINILKNVPDSVLWIKGGHESMERNLRGEVALRGVDTSRLVFAKHTALMQDHLARYRLADLFLDTFPFCAQTTASDALWAGVPVLTRVGESSMSRICASLLNAIELPELITKTQSEYEATAIELATNPVKLNAIKDKLARNRLTTALFDTPKFTKNIEAAYMQMYERYQDDLASDHIYIDA